jgi:putative oxidoreductase
MEFRMVGHHVELRFYMDVKKFFRVPEQSTLASSALLLIRVVGGAAFMIHGWGKIQDPFEWMGPDAIVPGFFQALAALSEFAGGLAWILGLLTPLASLGVAATMTVAVYLHGIVRGDPFVAVGGPSFELAAVYLSVALLLIATGPGRFALDWMLFGAAGTGYLRTWSPQEEAVPDWSSHSWAAASASMSP